MKIQVLRTDIATYQGKKFLDLEQTSIEAIGSNIIYRKMNESVLPDIPLILLTNTHTNPNIWPQEYLENTKMLVHTNSGYNNFSPEFVKSCNFPIVLGNEIRTHAVVEYTLTKLFSHFAHINNEIAWRNNRTWNRKRLCDQNVHIIGYGLIGQLVTKSISHLVNNLTIFDPFKNKKDKMIKKTDIVILCASLNPTSKYIIDKHFLAELPTDYLLINAARGALVKEQDLIESLLKNQDACAYIDVFENEPKDFKEFANIPNLHTTSHIAGVYTDINKRIVEFETNTIQNFVNSKNIDSFKQTVGEALLLKNRLHKDFFI
jgi:D-3-phosphoglycerate dehydrogenase